MQEVIKITKRGQAMIPKRLREKFSLKGRAYAIELKDGLMLKAVPSISAEKGSIRSLTSLTSYQLVKEARALDEEREKKLEDRARLRH